MRQDQSRGGGRHALSSDESLAAARPAAASVSEGATPIIPGYDLIQELGRGGMGTVYRAHKRSLHRDVAIKVIRRTGGPDIDALRRFQRESRAAARLHHPNVVSVYDAGATDAAFYLVMEYIEGTDLQRLVDGSGPVLIETACDYVRQAALGLQHAFEQGMVHRDIKPGNLMLVDEEDSAAHRSSFGRIKLLDLGLARFQHAEGMESSGSLLTQEGTIVGTPDFIAPEQVENSHGVDIRADLYSLGCTFFFLLTGQVPFKGKTVLEKLDQHRWRTPRPVERLRRGISTSVSAVVQKLLAKAPAERFQTPKELVDALECTAAPPPANRPQGAPPRKVETEKDICLDTLYVGDKRKIARELDRLQRALVQRIEGDELASALELAEAMVQIKPDDSAALAAQEFLRGQVDRSLPCGEHARLELPDKVNGVAVAPDLNLLAAAAGTSVHIVDATRNQLLASLAEHAGEVRDVAFSSDGRRLLSAGADHKIRLWDATKRQVVACFHRHTGPVNRVVWLSSDQEFISAGADKAIFVWDVNTGRRRCKIRGHTGDVKGIACSADGRRAVSASWDHTLRLWDLEAGAEKRRMGGGFNYFNGAALSPDSRWAVGAGADNVVRLYTTQSGEESRTFEGHASAVMSVAFSPDGRRILSGGNDGELRLWNVETGELILCLKGHAGAVLDVSFFPDGRKALSGGADRTLRVWRLPLS